VYHNGSATVLGQWLRIELNVTGTLITGMLVTGTLLENCEITL